MKHILPIMLSICLALTIPCPIFAADPTSVVIVQPTEELENGYYIETTLEYSKPAAATISSSTTSGKKTAKLKTSSGSIICSLTVYGTFTYNHKTSLCTSCRLSSTCTDKYWKITDTSSSKKGNAATAIAEIKESKNGKINPTILKVTLTCDASGKLH